MAYPVSLVTLIQKAKQRTNLEGAGQIIPDSEWTDYINTGLSNWWDEVRGSTWVGQYYRSQYQFQTTASQQEVNFPIQNPPPGSYYPLPNDFLAMTSVDIFLSPNLVLSARMFQEEQRNMFRWYPVGWLFDQPIFYNIWQNNIVFVPAPQSTFSVNINYVPVAPQLFNADDTFDSINGWEEYIVMDAAIKAAMKMGRMDLVPLFQAEMARQTQRIRSMAPRRDMSNPEVVHEISTDFWGWDLY
ncbi:MAG TPA: hypothetical protein VJ305_19830 [Streptosporangiaceae bacterium]|nr:hypothetical protein [Streptosporangiaceae bacterium]